MINLWDNLKEYIMSNSFYFDSPVGVLLIKEVENKLSEIQFCDEIPQPNADAFVPKTELLLECKRQLEEYFQGKRRNFELPLHLGGTQFQQDAWQALTTIPYGQAASYKDMAEKIGRPKAMRAIGNANHNNPIPIVIPCHRVIGANGKMVGYGGGIWRKEWLLSHELNNSSHQEEN